MPSVQGLTRLAYSSIGPAPCEMDCRVDSSSLNEEVEPRSLSIARNRLGVDERRRAGGCTEEELDPLGPVERCVGGCV